MCKVGDAKHYRLAQERNEIRRMTPLRFRCIVADPPWHYGRSWDTGSAKAAVQTPRAEPMPYAQMKLAEIKALPVGELAADQCDLYLWVTQKYLPDAFNVLKAWGFRYCQTLTWCKAPMGTGQGGLYCPTTEFLILGRCGRMPEKTRADSTWWQVTRQKRHSQKPEFFQDMIEAQSDGPRLELFARRARPGWAVWGNEVQCDITFPPNIKPYITMAPQDFLDSDYADLLDTELLVPHYLILCFAYYEGLVSIIDDHQFDLLARRLDKEWDDADHPHRHLIDRSALRSGGSYLTGHFPLRVMEAARSILEALSGK